MICAIIIFYMKGETEMKEYGINVAFGIKRASVIFCGIALLLTVFIVGFFVKNPHWLSELDYYYTNGMSVGTRRKILAFVVAVIYVLIVKTALKYFKASGNLIYKIEMTKEAFLVYREGLSSPDEYKVADIIKLYTSPFTEKGARFVYVVANGKLNFYSVGVGNSKMTGTVMPVYNDMAIEIGEWWSKHH